MPFPPSEPRRENSCPVVSKHSQQRATPLKGYTLVELLDFNGVLAFAFRSEVTACHVS